VERWRVGSAGSHGGDGADSFAFGRDASLTALRWFLAVMDVDWDLEEQYTLQNKTWE
jgi:hypothetical protein